MAPPNEAELRFRATLEDDVSPKADRLEKKLKAMGMSRHEIKTVVKAVDEASPRIKEVQKQIDQIPQQTVVNIQANTQQATHAISWSTYVLRCLYL
jgi:5-bromo-4-chloroindolyl phosphate hydrolysis protein